VLNLLYKFAAKIILAKLWCLSFIFLDSVFNFSEIHYDNKDTFTCETKHNKIYWECYVLLFWHWFV